MTQADFGIALLTFLIIAGFTLYVFLVPYRKEGKIVQTYKLYKVRDELIFLVAQEKLKEQDLLFQKFYSAINFFIQHSNHITLTSLVSAFRDARKKKLDPAESENWEKIHESLQRQDEEVVRVVYEFYQALFSILEENSFLLRLISRYSWIAAGLRGKAIL